VLSEVGRYLPEYLSPGDKNKLISGLKDFPENFQYYLNNKFMKDALQGDLWSDFTVVDFESGKRKSVKGIIISNSCDIDSSNTRAMPVSVTFVPLINLNKLKEFLEHHRGEKQAASMIDDIVSQRSTSFFYLPAGYGVEEDLVAYLNDIHAIPIPSFTRQANKITTLSQQGFYIFLLKLSIHFCRFQEGVSRF
jgi:hypothetical protein